MYINNAFKKVLCIGASCLIVCSSLICVNAATFNDIEGHWAEPVIEKWAERGIVRGSEGVFEPDSPIIRGDFAIIIERLMNYTEVSKNNFADLSDDAYYAEAILKLNKMSIMLGYNGLVSPEENITREEAFVMFNRVYNLGNGAKEITFADNNRISDWAYAAVSALCESGMINGSDENKIHPKDNITRAEVVQLLENISNAKILGEETDNPDYYVPNIGGGYGGGASSSENISPGMTEDVKVPIDDNIVGAGEIEW